MTDVDAIFIGANRQPHAGDIHPSSHVVAFGAAHTVALWDPLSLSAHGVYSTLKKHTGEVTCVRFLGDTPYLISAGEDSQVCVWKMLEDGKHMEFVKTLEGHNESVDCIGTFGTFFTTGDTNGKIILWKLDSETGDVAKLHTFDSKIGVLPLSLAIQEVNNGEYVLALGGTKFQIFIYTFTHTSQLAECTDLTLVAQLEGHEDWVKALAFKTLGEGDFLLASGSQDRYIRLWRLRTNERIDNSDEDETKLLLLSNKQYKFSVNSTKVAINFEALIMGHDDWIASLKWHETKLQLLASSADTAMMIWEPDESSGIWICAARLGEISSKGASTATGSSGGFWSALWFTDDEGVEHILTNGKTGAWRSWWSKPVAISDNEDDGSIADWVQDLAITGPTRQCTDISWSISGEYLLATSLDQTTRLYSRWLKTSDGTPRSSVTWREFARPQIHGYDMICIASLSDTRFISAGDEKILRSFDEPRGVASILNKFCSIDIDYQSMPESAALPALGLSNKATAAEDAPAHDQDRRETDETNNISYDLLNSLETPPLEDHLQRHTLWPEIEKLYGHGYEMISVDTSPDKRLVASSCRSNTQQHSVVRLFDTENWQELKPNLKLHNLTVTRVRFSPIGDYLLTVSRDRQLGLWKRDEKDGFEIAAVNEKAHTRIIWDCSWAPAEFGKFFFTASRDKFVKVWRIVEKEKGVEVELITQTKFSAPVTSIDVHKQLFNGKCLVAVGLETGKMAVLSFSSENMSVVSAFADDITPGDRIARISWSFIDAEKLLLAVASHDHSTRIYSVKRDLF